ncbi:MAG: hypothetical protein J6V68_04950 [Clostridia bacterium]|nr:hypothetical protein [Clostridia bacterium]
MNNNEDKIFTISKNIIRPLIKRPTFIFNGEFDGKNSVILSNHVGVLGPLTYELFFDKPHYFWGTHEMNDGLVSSYRYLKNVFYPIKKGWGKVKSNIVSIFSAPVSNFAYSHLNLIPTYKDARLLSTFKKSLEVLNDGNTLIIFPEDSSKGYFDKLKGFLAGFSLFGDYALKNNIDLNIYGAYFDKNNSTITFSSAEKFSALKQNFNDKYNMAEYMCNKVNSLRVKNNKLKLKRV